MSGADVGVSDWIRGRMAAGDLTRESEMEISWPQIIWILLTAMHVGINISRHGETERGKYNGISSAIAAGLVAGLLYWGGFFG